MIRRTFIAAAFVSMALAAAPALSQTSDVATVVAEQSELTTLTKALKAAGLVETLKGNGPFTVFAPSNAAFEALPDGTLETLLQEGNRDRLKAVLLNHVAPHKAYAAGLTNGMMGDTLNGTRMKVVNDGKTVTFGNAKVLKADLDAANGVVHVIDTVLVPK